MSGNDRGRALSVFAPAKINLYLHVTGRRADGYHLLDSLVVFADVGDRVSARPATGLSLRVEGPFADALQGADGAADGNNLVLRAARLLAGEAGIAADAELILDKHLPVASGHRRRSADAAATLLVLNRLWGLDRGRQWLAALAARLGADVPMCLESRPLVVEGIGERMQPVGDPPRPGLVLVNPAVALSTPAVFKARTGAFSAPTPFDPATCADLGAFIAALKARRNDLEPPAITLAPVVAEVLACLDTAPGCALARMSGSGATCFGLFPDQDDADRAAQVISADHPGWWVRTARFIRR